LATERSQEAVVLRWRKFDLLTRARNAFSNVSCIYVQTDLRRNPVRVGKATQGLGSRYRGGTGYAVDAAMHRSRNLIFVAPVPADRVAAVEAELIWAHRTRLSYNNQGKLRQPVLGLKLIHRGSGPKFPAAR